MSPAIRITRARTHVARRRDEAERRGLDRPDAQSAIESRGERDGREIHEAPPLRSDDSPPGHHDLRAHGAQVREYDQVRSAARSDATKLGVQAIVLGHIQARHLIRSHRRDAEIDRLLHDPIHVTPRQNVRRPHAVRREGRTTQVHAQVPDGHHRLQIAADRAFSDQHVHAQTEPLARLLGRDRLVAGANAGRRKRSQPGIASARRVPLHRFPQLPGVVDQRQQALRLWDKPVPVHLPKPQHRGLVQQGAHVPLVEHWRPRPVVGGQKRDDWCGGEGVDRLGTENFDKPARTAGAQGRAELAHLADDSRQPTRDRLPEELGQGHQNVKVGVAVDEARNQDSALDIQSRRPRAGQPRQVGPHRRDAFPRHRDVPPHELSGVDVDDVRARDEQVCRCLAEGDPHEPGAIVHLNRILRSDLSEGGR
jgi:hypothetical protein